MLKLHHYLLATASLALVGIAGAAPANAVVTTCNRDVNCSLGASAYTFGANDIFGGGSTLIGPYWRQLSDCYNGNGHAAPAGTGYADLVISGSTLTTPTAVDEGLFDYTGTTKFNCATTAGPNSGNGTTWYNNAGSGAGTGSFFAHDPAVQFGEANTNGPQYFPYEHYSASDYGLSGPETTSGTDVYCYYNGSCTEHKLSIGAPGTLCTSKSPYPVPAQCYGPLIEFPVSVDDVAIAFNPVYEKVVAPGQKEVDYSFRTTAIKFSRNTLCGIFTGTITNWNDPSITTDNGTSLKSSKDPTPTASWSVPLIPVGRTDTSGTTSIFTRHLAAICSSSLYASAGGTTGLPSGYVGNAYTSGTANYPGVDTTGKFTTATGSTGVAYYTAFTGAPNGFGNKCSAGTVLPAGYGGGDCIQQGRVGYMGADYVSPYVKVSNTVSVTLDPVEVENHANKYVKVGPTGALAAFAGTAPPTGAAEADASNWAEGLSASVSLADPTASTAYPFVGTTQVFAYQCYASAAVEANLSGELGYVVTAKLATDSKLGLLAKVGLAPLPAAWLTALDNAFITGSDGKGLQFSTASAGNTVSNCNTTTNTMLVGG